MANIRSYKSPKTEIKESKTQGKGIFAKEDIKKGEIIGIKVGHIVTYEEAVRLEKKLGEYSLQISDNFFLCPKTKDEVEDTALFINHSCDPNVGPLGQIIFVALKDIKGGEELCCDYAMTTSKDYKLKCSCGSKKCRKIITGEDWKLKELQEKYKEHFTSLILNKIQ